MCLKCWLDICAVAALFVLYCPHSSAVTSATDKSNDVWGPTTFAGQCYDEKTEEFCRATCSQKKLDIPVASSTCKNIEVWSPTMFAGQCYDQQTEEFCCATCSQKKLNIPVTSPTCKNIEVWSPTVFAGQCYDQQTEEFCCATCSQKKLDIPADVKANKKFGIIPLNVWLCINVLAAIGGFAELYILAAHLHSTLRVMWYIFRMLTVVANSDIAISPVVPGENYRYYSVAAFVGVVGTALYLLRDQRTVQPAIQPAVQPAATAHRQAIVAGG